MIVGLHQLTAALYLAAGLLAGVGLALARPTLSRAAVAVLVAGAGLHGICFAAFHLAAEPPPLTDLPASVSLMAFLGVLFYLSLLMRARLSALVIGVAPMAFLGAFFAALRLPHSEHAPFVGAASSWPHAHILLASGGLASLAVAFLAGLVFLAEDRRLKAKRPMSGRLRLPSLEALDRVNAVALVAGFPLLTLGVVTGMLWVEGTSGRFWTGAAHETWSMVAWAVYGVLVAARFRAHQGARQAAIAAVAGFAFLLFAVIGVGLLT